MSYRKINNYKRMKNTSIYYLILLFVLPFFSCSKDAPEEPDNEPGNGIVKVPLGDPFIMLGKIPIMLMGPFLMMELRSLSQTIC